MQNQSVISITRNLKLLAAALGLFVLAGCVTTSNTVQQIEVLEADDGKPRILLMPPDIKYYLLTTGGVPEPHAEWTEQARANFSVALENFAAGLGTDLTVMDPDNLSDTEVEYELLHSAVGLTVLTNHFGMMKLPTKGGEFDWTLGPGVSEVADQYDADYALFVYYRDYQASGGRVAFAILAAAAGAGVSMGSESGFASLVDLRTGDIVWFNRVIAGSGELRDEDGAVTAVNKLFSDIPSHRIE